MNALISVRRQRGSRIIAAAVVLALTAAVVPPAALAEAVIKTDNLFIRNDYVEVGARPNGSFGSNVAAPEGWHSNMGGDRIGFRADRDFDGWGEGIDDGDFFLPGGPYEGFGLQVGSYEALWNNNDTTNMTGSFVSTGTHSGVWSGVVEQSTMVDEESVLDYRIQVSQAYSVPTDGSQFLSIDVTLTNPTATGVAVLYARSLDPDNCQSRSDNVTVDGVESTCAGSYETLNTIEAQTKSENDNSAVSASQDDGSYIQLRTADTDSVAFAETGEWWCHYEARDLRGLWDAPVTYTTAAPLNYNGCSGSDGVFNKPGETASGDDVIGLVIKKTVPAGESVTFNLEYVLSEEAANIIAGTATPRPRGPAVTANEPTPVNRPDGTLLRAAAGTSSSLVGGQPTTVRIVPIPSSTVGGSTPGQPAGLSIVSSSDGTNFAIHFSPQTGDGTVGNDRNAVYGSTLVMNENDDITTRLEGFAPFSDVYVWLFSPPVLLGQFVADQNGTLDAAIAQLPDDVGGCPHTLHVAGRLSDGRAIGASLGIWVVPDPFPFADVAALSVHGPSVSCLEDLGAVHGFDDARFRETVAITRRQARNIVASLYGVDTAVRVMPAGTKGPLTRGEVATIVTQLITVEAALATFTDVAASVHADAIGALEAKGLLTGVTAGRFHPDKPVTRGQFASVIVRAYHDQQLAAQ